MASMDTKIIKINSLSYDNTGVVTITPPEISSQAQVNLVLVIDVSGSMSTEMPNPEGKTDGFTRLDITKHAAKTILHGLTFDIDTITIITFTDVARIVFEPGVITSVNLEKILKIINGLEPSSNTELWKGIEAALDVVKKTDCPNNIVKKIIVLTDGEPSDGNHLAKLKQYGDIKCTLDIFGFTYQLQSKLLFDIAKLGNGNFGFIPDAGFVGTAFVNNLSNTLVTTGTDLILTIEGPVDSIIGYKTNSVVGPNSITVNIGSIRDSPRNIGFVIKPGCDKKPIKISLSCNQLGKIEKITTVNKSIEISDPLYPDLLLEIYHNELIQFIIESIHNIQFLPCENIIKSLDALASKFGTSILGKNEKLLGFLADLVGQIKIALSSKKEYERWGKHYLLALLDAHVNEICTNFKDPGLQLYGGGQLWSEIRDKLDTMYSTLPAPKPSKFVATATRQAPVQTMASYNNYDDPCFAGSSLILTADGKHIRVDQVKKGTQLLLPNGKIAVIQCVVKTKCKENRSSLVELGGGLLITPYHPIKIIDKKGRSEWAFPCTIEEIKLVECDFIYSFVLDIGHIVLINGIECVTLGHSFNDNSVIKHSYFGSQRIIEDLKQLNGWSNGLIQLESGAMVRNHATGLIDSIDINKVKNI
jgi:hypothetical protein